MKIRVRFISYFLIVFGLLGYGMCIPVAYYGYSYTKSIPLWLEEASTQLKAFRETVNETSKDLQLVKSLMVEVKPMIGNISSSFDQVVLMLKEANETAHKTIVSANKSLYEAADMLDALSSNVVLQLLASDISKEAGEAADSMRSITVELNALIPFVNSTVSFLEFSLRNVKNQTDKIMVCIVNIELTIENWDNRLNEVSTLIDSWTSRLQTIRSDLWIINYGIYGLIGYIGLLHTMFLLIGLHLREK